MSLPIQFTTINGMRHDFSSCDIAIDELTATGVKDISWNHGLEPTAVRGNNPGKTGRTRGVYDAEGKISFYEVESQLFINALAAKGALQPGQPQGFMEVSFDITISRWEQGAPINTSKLVGCRIKKVDHQASEGGDALVVSFDLDVMRITENNLEPHLKSLVR